MSIPTLRTYFVSEKITGGGGGSSPKDMLSILNPSSSGVLAKLLKATIQCSNSGNTVIVEYEMQRITAHSGGTTVTPSKRELSDAASAVEARTAPTSLTGATRVQTLVMQSNTAQSPTSYEWTFGNVPLEAPYIFAPGEGLNMNQITSNNGDFIITLVWVET